MWQLWVFLQHYPGQLVPCQHLIISCTRGSGVDELYPYVACNSFVHINSFSGIWQNRSWPSHAPGAWMTNSHLYPPSYLYRAPELQDIIMINIQRWKVNDVVMKPLSIHYNLPCGHVLYLDRVIIHSKTTKFVDIPYPLTEQNSPIPSEPTPQHHLSMPQNQVFI